MTESLTVSEIEQQIDALSAAIERKEDSGQTVYPEDRARLSGLQKLLEAKRHGTAARD